METELIYHTMEWPEIKGYNELGSWHITRERNENKFAFLVSAFLWCEQLIFKPAVLTIPLLHLHIFRCDTAFLKTRLHQA